MTTRKIYMENGDGVHLGGAFDDRTLCGDVMEGDEDQGLEAVRETTSKIVTCEACVRIIKLCRGVRIT